MAETKRLDSSALRTAQAVLDAERSLLEIIPSDIPCGPDCPCGNWPAPEESKP